MDKEDLEATLKKIPELMRKREESLNQREKELERMKTRLDEEHPNMGDPSDVLNLNVGGDHVCVLRRTITQIQGSMLASRFSGRWDDSIQKDSDGRFFIDQDMELFRPLLNYLRALASQTQLTRPPKSPVFTDALKKEDFYRMVDYYGMTPGVFPIGLYVVSSDGEEEQVASYTDLEATSEEITTFWLIPENSVHKRNVKSFEVTMGSHTLAQIGWASWDQRTYALDPVAGGYKGVGYMIDSMALDSTRSGILVLDEEDAEEYVSVPGSFLERGSVIRCEEKGTNWKINGELKATDQSPPPTGAVEITLVDSGDMMPCLTVKGSFRITHIELDD